MLHQYIPLVVDCFENVVVIFLPAIDCFQNIAVLFLPMVGSVYAESNILLKKPNM